MKTLIVDELSYMQDKTSFKKCFYRKFSTKTCFITINLRKKKQVFSCSYNPNKKPAISTWNFEESLALYSKKYENLIWWLSCVYV